MKSGSLEWEIADHFYAQHCRRKHLVVPNYRPYGWSECDLFVLDNADLFFEVEIKTSRADFFADAKKTLVQPDGHRRVKHDLMLRGCHYGPVAFFYLLANGIVDLEEVPQHAGVFWINNLSTDAGIYFTAARRAQPLHNQRFDIERERDAIMRRLSRKYWSIRVNEFCAPDDPPWFESESNMEVIGCA